MATKQTKTPTAKPAAKAKKSRRKPNPQPPGRKAWSPDFHFIEDQARNGLTDKEISALTGVCHQTFCEKKHELPELVAALARGRAKGTSMAATALWKLIAQGDRQAAQFYLERKSGWKQDNGQQSVTIETNKETGTTKVTLGDLYKQLNDDSPEDI